MRTTLGLLLAVVAVSLLLLLSGHEGPQREDEPAAEGPSIGHSPPASGQGAGEVAGPGSAAAPSPDRGPAAGTVEPVGAAGLVGRVTDEALVPVAGASVVAARLDDRALRGGRAGDEPTLAASTTDTDGTFRLDVPRDVWLRVVAAAPGYARAAAWVPGAGTRVDLVLPRAGALELEVLDARGQGVGRAGTWLDVGKVRIEAATDPDGRLVCDEVPPGSVRARVVAEDGAEGRGGPWAVRPGETTRAVVVLDAGAWVVGRVVEATQGLPVATAEVHVARPGEATRVPVEPDGRFGPVLAGPAGERVFLAARAPGHEPVLVPVVLAGGDLPQELDVVLRPSPPWRGRVVDGTGRGVAGARVAWTADGVWGRAPTETRTDEAGRFEIDPPAPPAPGRQVILVAEGPEGLAAHATRPGTPPPPDLVLVLRRGARVTGRVVDTGGAPVGRVAVRLDPRWRELGDRRTPGAATARLLALGPGAARPGALQAETDDAGRFVLPDVPDGPYAVRLIHGALQVRGPAGVQVAGADVDVGTLPLGEGHRVEGRVVDPAGAPAAGAEVVLRAADEDALARHAVTASDGSFAVDAVPPGRVRLRVSQVGYLTVDRDLAVPANDPLEVALRAGGRIQGLVRREGAPYAGPFRVRLEPPEGRRATYPPSAHRAVEGRFVLEGLAEGSVRVVAETPDGWTARTPTWIEARPGGTWQVELDLEQGARITGTLRDAHGRGVAGGRVVLREDPDGPSRAATTTAAGSWQLDGLPPGAYALAAQGAGGAPSAQVLTLAAGEHARIDLDLLPAGAIDVEVLDPRGRPVADAYVLVRPQGESFLARPQPDRTDANGRTRLDDLPPGEVEVVARTREGRSGSAPARVQIDDVAAVRIALEPAER